LDDLLVTLMTYSNYGRGRHLPYVSFGTGSFLGLPDAEGIFCIAGPGWQYSQSRLCSSFWFSSVEVWILLLELLNCWVTIFHYTLLHFIDAWQYVSFFLVQPYLILLILFLTDNNATPW